MTMPVPAMTMPFPALRRPARRRPRGPGQLGGLLTVLLVGLISGSVTAGRPITKRPNLSAIYAGTPTDRHNGFVRDRTRTLEVLGGMHSRCEDLTKEIQKLTSPTSPKLPQRRDPSPPSRRKPARDTRVLGEMGISTAGMSREEAAKLIDFAGNAKAAIERHTGKDSAATDQRGRRGTRPSTTRVPAPKSASPELIEAFGMIAEQLGYLQQDAHEAAQALRNAFEKPDQIVTSMQHARKKVGRATSVLDTVETILNERADTTSAPAELVGLARSLRGFVQERRNTLKNTAEPRMARLEAAALCLRVGLDPATVLDRIAVAQQVDAAMRRHGDTPAWIIKQDLLQATGLTEQELTGRVYPEAVAVARVAGLWGGSVGDDSPRHDADGSFAGAEVSDYPAEPLARVFRRVRLTPKAPVSKEMRQLVVDVVEMGLAAAIGPQPFNAADVTRLATQWAPNEPLIDRRLGRLIFDAAKDRWRVDKPDFAPRVEGRDLLRQTTRKVNSLVLRRIGPKGLAQLQRVLEDMGQLVQPDRTFVLGVSRPDGRHQHAVSVTAIDPALSVLAEVYGTAVPKAMAPHALQRFVRHDGSLFKRTPLLARVMAEALLLGALEKGNWSEFSKGIDPQAHLGVAPDTVTQSLVNQVTTQLKRIRKALQTEDGPHNLKVFTEIPGGKLEARLVKGKICLTDAKSPPAAGARR